MAIKNKGTKENPDYLIRVNVRSKKHPNKFISRRRAGVTSLKKAEQIEKELFAECMKIVQEELADSIGWEEVVFQFLTDPQTIDNYSPNTVYRYQKSLESFTVEPWKTKSLKDIKTADIVQLIDEYATQYNWASSNKQYIKKAISAVFRYAKMKGYVDVNPSETIIYKRKQPDLNIWTLEQFQQFLKGVYEIDLDWYYIFAVAGLTGMRSGELYALRWKNIDFINRLIKVTENYSVKTKDFIPTKNKLLRNVPINDDLMHVIKELKIKTGGKPNDFVLPHPRNWENGEQAKVLSNFADSLGLDRVRFHDLRALAACQMHISGVPMHIIRSMLGWADLKTVDRYMRLAGSEVLGATDNFRVKLPSNKRAKVYKMKPKSSPKP